MNLELLIAKRIFSGQEKEGSISRPIVKIAMIGIAVGIAVMILSVAIVTGFKNEISDKVTGFASHIQITHYDSNSAYESVPIAIDSSFIKDIKNIEDIKRTQVYATKPGIIKSKQEIQGVILNGTDKDFDKSFISKNMVSGKFYELSDTMTVNSIVISQNMARMLKLKTGDKLTMWFVQQPVRARRFTISGIYDTGLQEFDNIYAFCDIKHIQKLNGWKKNQYSGIEIMLDDINNIDRTLPALKSLTSSFIYNEKTIFKIWDIRTKYPHIFDWLELLNMNVWIILILMIAVAGFNMVSGLLIIILEKTNMIGILKALGQKNINIRKIFLYLSARLIGNGLLWGNIAGISICLIQHFGEVIKLDPVSYYIDKVPININIYHILMLNAGSMIVTIFMLVIPSLIISNISPVKAIKFD